MSDIHAMIQQTINDLIATNQRLTALHTDLGVTLDRMNPNWRNRGLGEVAIPTSTANHMLDQLQLNMRTIDTIMEGLMDLVAAPEEPHEDQ